LWHSSRAVRVEGQSTGTGEAADAQEILVFTLDDVRFGVRTEDVVEIFRAVWITPLPGAPQVVEGVIDVRGRLVPVLDLRRRFGLPARPLLPDDHMVLVRAAGRSRALRVDRATDIAAVLQADIVPAGHLEIAHLTGVVRRADGLILLADLAAFLSESEAQSLDEAMA
jgi:purine-binding chemotaxis protein CheW